MMMAGIIVAGVGLLVWFICSIVVSVKLYRAEGLMPMILSLATCGVSSYVLGWVKSKVYQLGRLMVVWTLSIFAYVGGFVVVFQEKEKADKEEVEKSFEEVPELDMGFTFPDEE